MNPKKILNPTAGIIGIVALAIKLGMDLFSDYIVAGGFSKATLNLVGDGLFFVFIICIVLAFIINRRS